jgi:Tfp pilus assembly protein PilN
MYSLNLLPPEIKQEINYSKKNAKLVKYLGISLSAFLIILALFVVLAMAVNNEKTMAETQKASAQEIIEQNKEIEINANDLSERLKLIKKLKNGRTDWNAIFRSLADNTPTGVQLDSISFTLKEKTRAKITGFARSDRDIVLFKDLVNASEYFDYVDIENISEASDPTGGGAETKSFAISLTLKGAKK